MMFQFSYFLQVFLQIILAQIVIGSENSQLFQLDFSELQNILKPSDTSQQLLGTLENILSEDGAFAISGMPSEYSQAVIELQNSAPQCLDSEQSPKFSLPDGSTRVTWARDSSEHRQHVPKCIQSPTNVIHQFYERLDGLISDVIMNIAGEKQTDWLSKENPEIKQNFATINYKEHIHVYSKNKPENSDHSYAAPYHIDSGLLLFITPFQEHPLEIKNRNSEVIKTDSISHDSVIVIIASALPNWLLKGKHSSSKFFPAPHAVPSLGSNIASRTVFARMKVVPDTATPAHSSHHHHSPVLFRDFFMSGAGSKEPQNEAVSLCPVASESLPAPMPLEQEWSQLKKIECDTNEAFCWMNCLDLPRDTCHESVVCLNRDQHQCCTDTITENCANMDNSCRWQCGNSTNTHQKDHSHVVQTKVTEDDNKFCNGAGTDMYMQGFQTSGNSKDVCVILLFSSWTLDTRTKFVFGCIGVVILGIAIEAMLCFRRKLQKRKILLRLSGLHRRVAIIALFGVNIASGYFAMLVAMTYSVELFICMIVGLVIGHGIFNTGAVVGESVDPCCASQAISNDSNNDEASIMQA